MPAQACRWWVKDQNWSINIVAYRWHNYLCCSDLIFWSLVNDSALKKSGVKDSIFFGTGEVLTASTINPDLKFFQMMRRSKSAVYSQSTGTEKFESLQKGLGTNFWASHDAAVCRLNETKTKCKVDIAFISWKNKERRKVTETSSTLTGCLYRLG